MLPLSLSVPLFSNMQTIRFSHDAAQIMLMCPYNGLCYNDQYDIFLFHHSVWSQHNYVKTSTTTVTHMYVIYVTSSKVHNQELAMRVLNYKLSTNMNVMHMYPNHA